MERDYSIEPSASVLTDPVFGLTDRIRREYLEMPGLALTRSQAQRLWNMAPPLCEAVLAALVSERFLEQSRSGAYLRRAGR